MEWVKAPEIHKNDDIAPEVSKHFCNHTKGSRKRTCKSVLVFIYDYEALNFLHFISKNIHELLNEFCISLILSR